MVGSKEMLAGDSASDDFDARRLGATARPAAFGFLAPRALVSFSLAIDLPTGLTGNFFVMQVCSPVFRDQS